MPLVGQMPASVSPAEYVESQRKPEGFAERARETLGDAMGAVRQTFSNVTEPITHAQEKKEVREAECEKQCEEQTECALSEQHKAALEHPSMHDKTKIHMMMNAKHTEFYVPDDKGTKRPCEHSHANAKSVTAAIKQVFTKPSDAEVERKCLMEQHKAALANPSECDKTKFNWL